MSLLGGNISKDVTVSASLLVKPKRIEVYTQSILILPVLVVAALTEKHQQGRLVPLLADASVIVNNSAQL